MKPTPQHPLRLADPAQSPPSRARKQFNTLIKKLDAARIVLAEWKETLPIVTNKVDQVYRPLLGSHDERLKQMILLLDEMHGHVKLGKRERDKLSAFLSSSAYDLLGESDDAVLKDIFNRHSGDDFDAAEEETKDQVRRMMGDLLGVEFEGEIDLRSPESMLGAFEAHLGKMYDGAERPAPEETPRPKRTADQARERRQAAEAQRMQQSMRDIFRKLASQLHPDRETDETERLRKTALMQRVNAAYAARDMLGLLELQLEVEQIDQASLSSLSDERIRQYNRVLTEQLAELQREIAGFEELASIEMGVDIRQKVTPASMMSALDSDIAALRAGIDVLEEDLEALRDVKMLKAWLKSLPKAPSRSRSQPEDDLFW